MRSVLVTGGGGFIGSHMVLCLREAGYGVVVVDDLSNGHRDAVPPDVAFVAADIGDPAAMDRLFAAHRIDAVLHFAGFIEAGVSVREPLRFYRNNVGGTLVLLDAMRRHGVNALIFSSTAGVYGDPVRLPVDEDHPTAPVSPYGASKLQIERMLADVAAASPLRVIALRYFNAAGADPQGRLGERHHPETHLVPLVLRVAAGEAAAVAVFGDDWPTPDGTCVRDYVHVSDLARAHLLALKRLEAPAAPFEAFNLGTGQGWSVRQVIDAAARVTGRPVPFRVEPRRPGDPAVLVAAAGKAGRDLGWRPRYSDLDTIIAHAWAFRPPSA